MRVRSQKDLLAGFTFVIVGLCFAFVATGYELGTAGAMGPGYFPFGLGLLLAVLGVAILGFSLSPNADGERVSRPDFKIVLWVLGAVVLFGAALEPLGLVVSIFVLVVGSSFASHELDLKNAVGAAIFLNVLCVVTFVYGLKVQIPVWPSILVGG